MNRDWIESLRQYFFNPQAGLINIDAAMHLKKHHIPKSLFKFRGVNEYSLNNLEENTVWCTSASQFNDPYDSSLCFYFSDGIFNTNLGTAFETLSKEKDSFFTKEHVDVIKNSTNPLKTVIEITAHLSDEPITQEMEGLLYEALKDFENKEIIEMNSRFNDAMKNGYKICSFSERLDSTLMWAHYAENHSGFAIEYDFSKLPVTDVRSRLLWPVIYDDQLFDATQFFSEQVKNGISNNFMGVISAIHKAKDWEYENEWRLILPTGPDEPPLNYEVPLPVCVYLGAKIEPEKESLIVKIAQSKNIPIFKMRLAHDKFKMIPQIVDLN